MKKIAGISAALTILATLLMGFWGISLIRASYQREIHYTLNLAGAVLSKYPQAGQTVITAIHDNTMSHLPEGLAALSSYGYDETLHMRDNPSWETFLTLWLGGLTLFLVLIFLLEAGFFLLVRSRQRDQEAATLAILDRYFSEDYQFIADQKLQESIGSPHMADILIRLGTNLKEKTEHLNEERDNTKTLVTDISHQLKTPLSALKTCFSMYLEADTPEEREEFLKRTGLQMEKLESLVASLMQISRLETSLIALCPEPVPLRTLLTDAVNAVYLKAAGKHILIDVGEFEDIELMLDRKWTAEALVNVLDNAVKYSPEGGRLKIRVQPLFTFVRLEIEDEGIGIPREEQNKIFGRFYRGNSETVRQSEGAGVGLYLTRKILEEQGGTVTVHPASVKGSVFVIQLPGR